MNSLHHTDTHPVTSVTEVWNQIRDPSELQMSLPVGHETSAQFACHTVASLSIAATPVVPGMESSRHAKVSVPWMPL